MIKPLLQRIVVAYNGSQSSLRAVLYAIMMAKTNKCDVKVIYVVDTDSIKKLTISHFMIPDEAQRVTERLRQDGQRNLDYVTGVAKSKGVKIETQMREGAVWSQVITAADEFKADLILLGGTTGSEDTGYLQKSGVTAQDREIIGSAHCSVMVVRQPHIEQLFKLV